MQQKRINANYIDPEESAVMATNHLTTTVEQDEAEAEELRLYFEQAAKLPEWRTLYADEIEATIDCYLRNNPKVKREAFIDTLHAFLKHSYGAATTPTEKRFAILQVLISFI